MANQPNHDAFFLSSPPDYVIPTGILSESPFDYTLTNKDITSDWIFQYHHFHTLQVKVTSLTHHHFITYLYCSYRYDLTPLLAPHSLQWMKRIEQQESLKEPSFHPFSAPSLTFSLSIPHQLAFVYPNGICFDSSYNNTLALLACFCPWLSIQLSSFLHQLSSSHPDCQAIVVFHTYFKCLSKKLPS